MGSIDLETLKLDIINSVFKDVTNRRRILISYLFYINKQYQISEFSNDFNFYVYACTPDNEKIPLVAFGIFDDIINYILTNNIQADEINILLHLPYSDSIAFYIKGIKEKERKLMLELPEEILE